MSSGVFWEVLFQKSVQCPSHKGLSNMIISGAMGERVGDKDVSPLSSSSNHTTCFLLTGPLLKKCLNTDHLKGTHKCLDITNNISESHPCPPWYRPSRPEPGRSPTKKLISSCLKPIPWSLITRKLPISKSSIIGKETTKHKGTAVLRVWLLIILNWPPHSQGDG